MAEALARPAAGWLRGFGRAGLLVAEHAVLRVVDPVDRHATVGHLDDVAAVILGGQQHAAPEHRYVVARGDRLTQRRFGRTCARLRLSAGHAHEEHEGQIGRAHV